MQHGKDRLGQEEEPTPVDRVEETFDLVVVLVVADRFPFLGTGKKARTDVDRLPRFDRLCRQEGGGLVDVAGRVVLGNRFECTGLRDQGGHPVMIGEADPAAFCDLCNLGRAAPLGVDFEIGHVGVIDLAQFAIGHADHAFMQDEEVLQLFGFAVAG